MTANVKRGTIIFFKPSGKYYSEGNYISEHHIWTDEFKRDVRETQTAVTGEWWDQGWFVLTDDNDGPVFQYHLWVAGDFAPK